MFNQFPALNKQKGFGMTEVIVSMLVLGVAVIGFSALQVRALDVTGDSMFRTQAIALAQDLGERIMLNPSGATKYKATWNATNSSNCETASCTPEQMAEYDIKSVTNTAKQILPNGQIKLIKCIERNNYCVYVTWNKTQPNAEGAADSCSNENDTFVTNADCVKLETSLL